MGRNSISGVEKQIANWEKICNWQNTVDPWAARVWTAWFTYSWTFFSKYLSCLWPTVGSLWIQRSDCADLHHAMYRTWVSMGLGVWGGSWDQFPMDTERQLSFRGVKSYTWNFNSVWVGGVGAPNPHVVQGSAVVLTRCTKIPLQINKAKYLQRKWEGNLQKRKFKFPMSMEKVSFKGCQLIKDKIWNC